MLVRNHICIVLLSMLLSVDANAQQPLCSNSSLCQNNGLCTPYRNFCIANSKRRCLASVYCKAHGVCGFKRGNQVCHQTNAGCKRSTACKKYGRCKATKSRIDWSRFKQIATMTWKLCAPAKESDCRQSAMCRSEGLCNLAGNPSYGGSLCVAGDNRSCRSSKACREEGRCNVHRGKCIATSDNNCRRSRRCKTQGKCFYHKDQCADPCRVSSVCIISGKCKNMGGKAVTKIKCRAVNTTDCFRSKNCKALGNCTVRKGICVPQMVQHCTRSSECLEVGKCILNNIDSSVPASCIKPNSQASCVNHPHGFTHFDTDLKRCLSPVTTTSDWVEVPLKKLRLTFKDIGPRLQFRQIKDVRLKRNLIVQRQPVTLNDFLAESHRFCKGPRNCDPAIKDSYDSQSCKPAYYCEDFDVELRRCKNRDCIARVPYVDAVRYANALSIKHGLPVCYKPDGRAVITPYKCQGYRLPTAYEWILLAIGPDLMWKNASGALLSIPPPEAVLYTADGTFRRNIKREYLEQSVTTFPKQGYGLQGMYREWCFDYTDTPNQVGPSIIKRFCHHYDEEDLRLPH